MKTFYDEIFVVHLANDKSRMKNIQNQFKYVNLPYTIWWTTKRPFSNVIAQLFREYMSDRYYENIFRNGNHNVLGNVFNCALAHYDIIKTSFERGLEHILICEDDIDFIETEENIENVLNMKPMDQDDFGIIKYHNTAYIELIENKCSEDFSLYSQNHSTLCYGLSRIGMEYFIDVMNEHIVPADVVFCLNQYESCFKKFIYDIYNSKKYENMKIWSSNIELCKPYDESSNII